MPLKSIWEIECRYFQNEIIGNINHFMKRFEQDNGIMRSCAFTARRIQLVPKLGFKKKWIFKF
jgi:hypothetical protein